MSSPRKGFFRRIRDFFFREEEIEKPEPPMEPEPEPEPPTIIERVVEVVKDIIPDEIPFITPEEPPDKYEEDWEDTIEEYEEEEEPMWLNDDLVFLQLQAQLTYNSTAGDWYKENKDREPDIIGEDEDGILYNKTFRHDTALFMGNEIGNIPKEELLDPENMHKLVKLSMKEAHAFIYDGEKTSHKIKEIDKAYGTFRLKDEHYVFYRTPKRKHLRVKQITDPDRIAELRRHEQEMGD